MLTHTSGRTYLLIVLALFATASAKAEMDKITLKKALAGKKISMDVKRSDTDFYHSLTLTVTNTTKKPMELEIDPGMIFVPEDTNFQNLVTLGTERTQIEPGATKEVKVADFCGKSYAKGPRPGMKFSFWKQGDSLMIKTLKFARENALPTQLIQHAVWHFTNSHSLRSVYLTWYPNESEKLVKYMADLRHVPVPEYFKVLTTSTRPGEPMIKKDNSRVVVPVHWPSEGYRNRYVTVYRENGDVYKRVEGDRIVDKYGTSLNVEFKSKRDLPGRYKVEARDNNNRIWFEKVVEIDPDTDLF